MRKTDQSLRLDGLFQFNFEQGDLFLFFKPQLIKLISIDGQDNEEEQDEITSIIQARFIRAVAQLQFLGFVQSSKRKTDHVARLTWGL